MSATATGLRSLQPVWAILLGAATVLSLSLGLRQSLGIFMPPITQGPQSIGITVAQFTAAVAVQNLAWGLLQPLAGAWAARVGFRPLMVAGAVLYVAALVLLASAQGLLAVVLSAGVMIGASLACTGSALTMSVATRVVSPANRSLVLGMVSAVGSLGAMIAAPIGQMLAADHGWRWGVAGFAILSLVMIPAAWVAGRADKVPLPAPVAGTADGGSAMQAVRQALHSVSFLVMAGAYFVCGMQLVFLTTHLPAYLAICGMDPMLSAQALGMIGAFNVLGSLFFGWAGGRWNKQVLLGLLYCTRSLVLAAYFVAPPTPASTLVFAGVMGFLWLGVAPLVAGSVAEMFGLRWQAMIQGVAFFSHQMGSFLGAFGGGLLYTWLGNYELAWRVGVGLGLFAGLVQMAVAIGRPPAAGRLAPA
ncbi:MFS transporter [Pseudaquabacterium pictum]|uniref:MFS transporter n=1 Tax=Pseudaquabacterium pictum TaxID=2315236 RepID=A0A480ATB0_9BURK|nr:MFS transporter [Rubrivivax pictus]GCL62965.1 MFS transporter [Rubrivivax pictus]